MIERKRWYAWSHVEGPTLLRHGCAHLVVRGAGTLGHPDHRPRRRRDLQVGAEWRVLARRGHGVGVELKWGTNGSETTPDLAVHAGWLGDLWLHFANVLPWGWLERHRPDGSTDYDTRVLAVNVSSDVIRWEFWNRQHHHHRDDPWWMYGYYRWERLAFGRHDTTSEQLASGTCLVPMPEANYPATFTTTRYTHRYRTRRGLLRDRLLGTRGHVSTNIGPGKPVPVPGKGENSWDCGDNAIWSISSPGASVHEAVGALVTSALRQRRQYGGEHMSVPAGEVAP